MTQIYLRFGEFQISLPLKPFQLLSQPFSLEKQQVWKVL